MKDAMLTREAMDMCISMPMAMLWVRSLADRTI